MRHGFNDFSRGVISKMKWTVVLCVSLVMVGACSPRNESLTTDTEQHKVGKMFILPKACEPIEPLLVRCKSTVQTEAEAKKLLAVLSEQLQTAPAAEQLRICQDVQQFWHAACGVAQ